jgi:formylglycine-generating enzyme required for sulfatase activity
VTEALEAFKNPPPSFLAKHGTLVGVIAAAVLVLAGGAFGAWWLATHRPLPEDLVSGLDEARQCIAGKQFASAEKLLVELDGRFEPTQEIEDAKNLLVDAGHEHAGSFARKHNYEEALEILRAVTAAARGVGRAGEHGARIDEVESQKTAFSTRAREVYGDLIDELPGLPEGEQVTKLEAFMEAFPWTAPAKQARLQLQKVSVHWRQGLVLDEVEETLSGLTLRDAEIDQTLAEARRELTDVKLFGALESERKKRYEALKKDLEFLESVHKGIEACEAGDFDEGLPMLRVKAAAFPDDPRARQGLAWGRSLREEDLGRVEEEAGNPEGALKHYRKARTLREEAGFDVEAISQKIDEFDQEADRFKEVTRKVRVVEKRAERAEAENRWSQAFKLREEAFGLRSTQERKALLERARKKARVDEEEKAYGTLLRKLKATRLSEGKQALCRAFLDEFPDGAHRERVRDLLELEAERVFQKPEAQPIQPGRRPGEFRNPRDGATMVKVEAGRFFRGTSKEEAALTAALWGAKASFFKPEQPMAEVELSAFYVDVFEVTNEQYGAFLEAIASIPEAQRHHFCHEDEERGKDHTPEFWRDSRWNRKDLPVVGVDWFDAFAYARWTGKRLPTEAQWERAARGTQRLRYPWGQDGGLFLSNGAEVWAGHKFKGNSDIRAWQVSKLWEQHGLTVNGRGFGRDRSVEGCRHMAGNVREWCVDWYLADAYEKPTGKDPVATEPGPNQQKATRGGSWFDTGMYHRVTLRRKLKPLSRRFDVGFRCVRDVE